MTAQSRLEAVTEAEAPGVFEITMTAGSRRNALSAAMVGSLVEDLQAAHARGCRVAILRAESGVRTWSAGFAIDELPAAPERAWEHPMQPLTEAIRSAPFPVIAAVEGGAWGGACEVALTCDLIVAEADASFALTPARIGVGYDADALRSMAQRLPRQLLVELIATAAPIGALRLYELGIVSRVARGSAGLHAAARGLAAEIAAQAPLSISAAKAVLAELGDDIIVRRRNEAWTSSDYREGLSAFRERRDPIFRGE